MRSRRTTLVLTTVCTLTLLATTMPAKALVTYEVTTAADAGAGSLRQAITDANASVGADAIEFDIPGVGPHTIALATPLPLVTEEVNIDGRTQTGWTDTPVVKIDGSAIPTDGGGEANTGLWFNGADQAQLRGLSIGGFEDHGVFVFGADQMVVSDNFIGIDPDGSTVDANGRRGIVVFNAADVVVGGFNAGDGNVVSGNASFGIEVTAPDADNVLLLRNKVGTDATGTLDRGNGIGGIFINDGQNIRVGNGDEGAGNLISGNDGSGVAVAGLTDTALIYGNTIGVAADGSTPLANSGYGISDSGDFTVLGGTAGHRSNTIGHNALEGIKIESGADTPFLSVNSLFGNGGDGSLELPDPVTAGPVIDTVIDTPSGVYVEGTFTGGEPNFEYSLHRFNNESCGTSTSPNATFWEGTGSFTTDGNGDAVIHTMTGGGLGEDDILTFLASDPDAYSNIGPCVTDFVLTGIDVDAAGSSFTPASPQIARGTGVVWQAGASAPHTVTDNSGMDLFDSPDLGNGEHFGQVFTAAGTYPYVCEFHGPAMSGSVKLPISVTKVGKKFQATWSSEAPEAGFAFDVQVKTPERNFKTWQNDTTLTTGLYAPKDGRGKYVFRARLVEIGGATSGYSPLKTIKK